MSEHDEQAKLFQLLRLNESKYPLLRAIFAIPNGGHRHAAVAAKMKKEGVRRGVWDVFVPFPMHGFHGMFLELTHGKNK